MPRDVCAISEDLIPSCATACDYDVRGRRLRGYDDSGNLCRDHAYLIAARQHRDKRDALNIGRYISSDPAGIDGGLNTFLYAEANPVMQIDPNGRGLEGTLTAPGVLPTLAELCAANPVACLIGAPAAGFLGGYLGVGAISDMILNSESDHPDEQELLDATCANANWAIPALVAAIEERWYEYDKSGGGDPKKNPEGAGHLKRIRILEAKLKQLQECPKTCDENK